MTEREIRVTLKDGSEVIMNTGDRVLYQASRPGAIPLAVDADTIIDDVLAALEEAEQRISEIEEHQAAEQYRDIALADAQQTIARQRDALNKAKNEFEMIWETTNNQGIERRAARGMKVVFDTIGEGAKES